MVRKGDFYDYTKGKACNGNKEQVLIPLGIYDKTNAVSKGAEVEEADTYQFICKSKIYQLEAQLTFSFSGESQ